MKNDKKGWAVSLGEQLSVKDLGFPDDVNENIDEAGDIAIPEGIPNGDCAARWICRALKEELGIEEGSSFYDVDKARFVALNLEGDRPNLALCCILRLNVDHDSLRDRIRNNTRKDYEFDDDDFIDIDKIPEEMFKGGRPRKSDGKILPYHPSSHIRMAYAFMFSRSYYELILALRNIYEKQTK